MAAGDASFHLAPGSRPARAHVLTGARTRTPANARAGRRPTRPRGVPVPRVPSHQRTRSRGPAGSARPSHIEEGCRPNGERAAAVSTRGRGEEAPQGADGFEKGTGDFTYPEPEGRFVGIPLNDDAPTRKPPDMDAIGARASTACAPRSEGARGRPRQLSGVSGNCRVRYPTKESLCHKASLASSGLSGRSRRWWYAAPTKGGEASFS